MVSRSLDRGVPTTFVTNDADVLRGSALNGLGICCLIAEQASGDLAAGHLVEVLPGLALKLPPNHIYYPSRS